MVVKALQRFEAQIKGKLRAGEEKFRDRDDAVSTHLAMLLAALTGFIEVLWDGKAVMETDLAPFYAMAERRRGRSLAADTSGQTNLASLFIGIMIAAIVCVRVFIPVVQGAIEDSNVSGTEKTILELLPMFAALLLLIALASPLMRRTG